MERERLLRRVSTARTVGLVGVAIGLFASLTTVTWVGVSLVVAAMAVITVARIDRLRETPLSPAARTRLAASWTLFVVLLSAFLVVAVPGEVVPAEGRLFWALAAATGGLLIAYRLFHAAYLPDDWSLTGDVEDGESAAADTDAS
ncbi:hypothetical protein [Halobaculum sp. EA56]|uniref:hypothetical protein n=1 Tax=Halobaculum sp. EA56 TaxID=3421648 RepID=UPI003EB9CECA